MADALQIETLVGQIEAHDASAMPTISALGDRCLVDARKRTLFDVAILANNIDVIAVLAADGDALEFAAPVDDKTRDRFGSAAANYGIEVPVSKLETILEQSFGEDLAYGRTPLHTACRAGNADAMQTLLAAGAKTNTKDAIGLSEPELAFYAHGETGLRDFVAAFRRSGQAGLPVSKRLLRETFAFPGTMAELLEVAELDTYARRLLFCYRCAWLDIDAVKSMLAEGYDPNKGLTVEINPLWEACTSALLWDETIPGGFEMAFHFTKYIGHPAASHIHVDDALLNEGGFSFRKMFKLVAEARRERKAKIKLVRKMKIKADTERDVIARRIALLDLLLDAGAKVSLARKKLELATFGELAQMGLGEVADHLKKRGKGAARPPKKKKPAASTWWDLPVETGLNTEYWPDEGAGGLLRLILHNVYGPLDDVTLSVRLSRDKTAPGDEWQELQPITETVEVDGETMLRADLNEPVYGECPWEAIYELPLKEADGATVLWIRLDHEDEALRGELDPWQFQQG